MFKLEKMKIMNKKFFIILVPCVLICIVLIISIIMYCSVKNVDGTLETMLSNINNIQLSNLVEESNTYTGMNFKISKEEYEENYLNFLESMGGIFEEKSFKLSTKNTSEENDTSTYYHNLYYGYPNRRCYFKNFIEVDNNTNKVISVTCLIVPNLNSKLDETATKDVIFAMLALNKPNEKMNNEINDVFLIMLKNNELHKFEKGISYFAGLTTLEGLDFEGYSVTAITEENEQKVMK